MITVTINMEERHQRMEGFGASGSWTIDPIGEYWSEENRMKIAELLFSQDLGIGLSIWKFNAGASGIDSEEEFFSSPYAWRKAASFRPREGETYDWSAHAGQRWFLEAARDFGVGSNQLIYYSPPPWMTKNGLTHPDADSGTTNLDPERLGDFVGYMADILVFLEDSHGVEFSDVVPLNEPNWAWNGSNQEANRYSVEDIKTMVKALSTELTSRGLSPRIVTPEAGEILAFLDDRSFAEYWFGVKRRYNSQNLELTTGGKYREYCSELLGDPEIRTLLGNTVSAHSYWSDTSDTADDRLVRLRRLVREDLDRHVPGAVYLQTEYCILGDRGPGRDLTMKSAVGVAEVIHRDLTLLDAAEWSWWLAVSPHDYKDGLLYTDWDRPGDMENILTSKIFWVLGQFSRFIRPGYTRVGVSAAEGGSSPRFDMDVLVSAYASPGGARVVTVFVNTGDRPAEVKVSWDSVSRVYRTSASEEESLSLIGTIDGRSVLVLPPVSVTTLVSD